MNKAKRVLYWIATVWLSLGMVSTGIAQLLNTKEGPGAVDSMLRLGYPLYLLTFIGLLKIAGSIIILAPKVPALKEWAYAGFFFIMAGAAYSHIAIGDPAAEVFPAILLLLLTVASWALRPANRKMVVNQ